MACSLASDASHYLLCGIVHVCQPKKIGDTLDLICQTKDCIAKQSIPTSAAVYNFYPPCPIQNLCPKPNGRIFDDHLLTGLALASPNFLLFGESNHLNLFDFSASLKIVNNRRILSRKVALQNKSPYFGSKQPVLLPAVAKTPPELNKLWSKVLALSKSVLITALTKAATDPRKDDQLAETQVKVLEENIC